MGHIRNVLLIIYSTYPPPGPASRTSTAFSCFQNRERPLLTGTQTAAKASTERKRRETARPLEEGVLIDLRSRVKDLDEPL